jgi:hypothetical protein
MLQKKFGIKFEDFAKAVVNRHALRGLAEKLDGFITPAEGKPAEHARPKFMSLLMSIMDFEHHKGATLYRVTEQLIMGKKGIVISKQMKQNFPVSLLDKKGNIRGSIIEKYSLVDEGAEEKKKLPVAA